MSGNKLKYLFILLLLPLFALAQADSLVFKRGRNYKLHINNGDVVTGFIVDQEGDYVTVESRPLLIRTDIRKSAIVKVEMTSLRENFEEDALGENPHADIYLTCGTALPFEPQRIRSTAHWLIVDNLEYAINKNWALHVSSITFYPFALGLKCSFKLDDMNYIGGNVTGMAWLGETDSRSEILGVFSQAKFTHGTSNRNFSIGAGFLSLNAELIGIFNSNILLIHMPIVSAGFCNRFASRWSLVADGHFLPDENIMVGGFGLKFLRDKYSAWNFGCYSLINDLNTTNFLGIGSFSYPLPYLSYTRVLD